MANNFHKAMKKFSKYGDRVVALITDKCPEAQFTMRFLADCFGNNVPASIAADTIIRIHRYELAEKELKKHKK